MPGVAEMAKKGRPKKKAPVEVRTIALRCTVAWAEWVEALAKHDRLTVAQEIDRALAEHAKAIGFTEAPPERLP